MKLIAEKVTDQYRCVVPNLGVLSFSELPTEEYLCGDRHYDNLPDWCQSIIDLHISKGYMFRASIETDQYELDVFIFDKANLNHCKEGIENILRNSLIECLEWRKEELEE